MTTQDLEIAIDRRIVSILLTQAGAEIRAALLELAVRAAHIAGGVMKREIILRLAKNPTGALARSVRPEIISKSETELVVHVGPHTIYANIQDQGGVVYPKKKYLAIPLSFANVSKGKWPRDWGKGELRFVDRSKKGKDPLLVYGKTGEPKYVLKRSAKIPGVGYAQAAADESQDEVAEVIAAGIEVLLERVRTGVA